MTIYMNLGGRSTITRAVDSLVECLQQDPEIPTATSAWIGDNRRDLLEFLIFLTGGSPVYDGLSVSKMLSPLCPSRGAFEHFVDHLAACMIGPDRPATLEVDLRLLMEHIRPHVVDRSQDEFLSSMNGSAVA